MQLVLHWAPLVAAFWFAFLAVTIDTPSSILNKLAFRIGPAFLALVLALPFAAEALR